MDMDMDMDMDDEVEIRRRVERLVKRREAMIAKDKELLSQRQRASPSVVGDLSLGDRKTQLAAHKKFCAGLLAEIPFATREDRSERAKEFLRYYAKSDHPVIKACAWLGAEHLWNDQWLGINCVALHGIDSLCVVVRKDDLEKLERKRLLYVGMFDDFLQLCWNAIVNEVQDIEDRRMFERSRKRPFSVVTVISCTSEVGKRNLEASRAEYRAKKTIKFLHEEMKSDATFTFDKTIQTAISALQHLFNREFKAHEILAYAWKDCNVLGKELKLMRVERDVGELLARINDPDNDPDMIRSCSCLKTVI